MNNMTAHDLLQQYQTQLDQHFTVQKDATVALNQWLAQQFPITKLIHLLQALLNDQQYLEQVASRSYQHGNGFLKVVLLDRGYKLRLHIWFAGQSCEENIRDHRWSFSSLILAGQLTSGIWQDDAHGQAFQEFEYHAICE